MQKIKLYLLTPQHTQMSFLKSIGVTGFEDDIPNECTTISIPDGLRIVEVTKTLCILCKDAHARAELLKHGDGWLLVPYTAHMLVGFDGKWHAVSRLDKETPVKLTRGTEQEAENWLDIAYPGWRNPMNHWPD